MSTASSAVASIFIFSLCCRLAGRRGGVRRIRSVFGWIHSDKGTKSRAQKQAAGSIMPRQRIFGTAEDTNKRAQCQICLCIAGRSVPAQPWIRRVGRCGRSLIFIGRMAWFVCEIHYLCNPIVSNKIENSIDSL